MNKKNIEIRFNCDGPTTLEKIANTLPELSVRLVDSCTELTDTGDCLLVNVPCPLIVREPKIVAKELTGDFMENFQRDALADLL